MQVKPDGDFLVRSGETITVTVTASDTAYQAAISALSHATWKTTSVPNVPPGSLREVREFTVVNATDSFDISFAFLTSTAPAKYQVKIAGSDGGAFDDEIANPDSPIPAGQDYTFVTS